MNEPMNGQPAAPESTSAIAARALESLEQAQTPSETPAASPTPSSTPAPVAKETPTPAAAGGPPSPSEAESLLREAGYQTERKPDGREHWIPRSKVLKMIETGLKKRAASLEKEREQWTGQKGSYEKAQAELRQWQQLMQGDPRTLLQRMADLDPRYKAFLAERADPQAIPKADDDPEPPPDVDLGHGRATYSLEGLRKRDAWVQRQMERRFEQRLQPIAERIKADEQREAEARYERVLEERSASQIARAKSWPKWAEHEEAIVKALREDSKNHEETGAPLQYASLHDAYIAIVTPHLMGDHQSVRESVMKELNTAPRSTSVGTTGPEPTKTPGHRTTEEIARRAMARLENGR